MPEFSTLQIHDQIPFISRAALVIRHSIRVPINDRSEVYFARLTPEGVTLAQEFGSRAGSVRRIGRIVSSPVSRCVDTAVAIAEGAGWINKVRIDHHLSHAFIENAWNHLPVCFPDTPVLPELKKFLDAILPKSSDGAGILDIFVTHDSILQVLAGYFFCESLTGENWPDYLEGIWLWLDGSEIHLSWRNRIIRIPCELFGKSFDD